MSSLLALGSSGVWISLEVTQLFGWRTQVFILPHWAILCGGSSWRCKFSGTSNSGLADKASFWTPAIAGGWFAAAAAAKSLQLCLTLWDPIDVSPPGPPVPGILQARTLEWVAISFSNAWKWKVKVKSLSRARLLATPWTAAYQAPPPMGFSRQEYWSGLPLPSPMDGLGTGNWKRKFNKGGLE